MSMVVLMHVVRAMARVRRAKRVSCFLHLGGRYWHPFRLLTLPRRPLALRTLPRRISLMALPSRLALCLSTPSACMAHRLANLRPALRVL